MKKILIRLLYLSTICLQLEAQNSIIFYNHNMGFNIDSIELERYLHTRSQENEKKPNISLSIDKESVGEALSREYIKLLNNNNFDQIIPMDNFSVISRQDTISVLKHNTIKKFQTTLGSYEDFKDNILVYINSNSMLYKNISKKIYPLDKPDMYFISTYLPNTKGRIDIYEKRSSDNNTNYSIESILNLNFKIAIYKYFSSNNRFRFYKEFQTPYINISKQIDKNTFETSTLNKPKMHQAIKVKLYRTIQDNMPYIKKEISKLLDVSPKENITNIDNNFMLTNSQDETYNTQEPNTNTNKQEHNDDDLFNQDIKNDDAVIAQNENIPLGEDIEIDNRLQQNNTSEENDITSSMNLKKISANMFMENASLLDINSNPLSISAISGILSYKHPILSQTYMTISAKYGISSLGENLPKLNTIFEVDALNSTYEPSPSVSIYGLSIGAEQKISLGSAGLYIGVNVNTDITNITYLDFAKNDTDIKLFNILLEPILSIDYSIASNISIKASTGYSIPVFDLDINEGGSKSAAKNFTRASNLNLYMGLDFNF